MRFALTEFRLPTINDFFVARYLLRNNLITSILHANDQNRRSKRTFSECDFEILKSLPIFAARNHAIYHGKSVRN